MTNTKHLISLYLSMVIKGSSHTDSFRATCAYYALDELMSDRLLSTITEL